MVQLEVIGAGYGRTGTMSLKKALEILGFNPCHHMMEIWGKVRLSSLLDRFLRHCNILLHLHGYSKPKLITTNLCVGIMNSYMN